MELLTQQMTDYIGNSSSIRRMFEAGIELKQKHGTENVFDFSLGNPDLPPPPATARVLDDLAAEAGDPLVFGYLPNAGLPGLRAKLAAALSEEQNVRMSAEHVVVTCGAAGALNVLFRSVLEPGDEVICPAPYFVEYGFYAGNFGGVLRPVPCKGPHFTIDPDGIEQAITPKTRAVIVNSPNNPTGQICTAGELQALADILARHSRAGARPIFLVSDEPYRFLTYDGVEVPPILPFYEYSLVAGSFSKSFSLAGERVGYIAVHPAMPGVARLVDGLILANRILGFVNAPVIGQYILERTLGDGVDVSIYDERRHVMADVLNDAGIEFYMPQGAFYFFPKTPGKTEDKDFVLMLQAENILAVPGTGFGWPGHFRLTFCMNRHIIERAAEGFKKAARKALATSSLPAPG